MKLWFMKRLKVHEEIKYPRYRWAILGLAWFVFFSLNFAIYITSARAHDLIPALGLNRTSYAMVLTAPMVAAFLFSIPGGSLADRYGIRLVVGIGSLLSATALIARMFATNFGFIFGTMLIAGIGLAFVFVNLPKMLAVWFPIRQMGMASGIFTTGMGVGIATGLLTGAAFITWQRAFPISGVIVILAGVLWCILDRSIPPGMNAFIPPTSLRETLEYNVKLRSVWLMAVGGLLFFGTFITLTGALPYMLEQIHHLAPTAAGVLSSCFIWAAVAGNFVGPPISDRIELRKPIIYFAAVVGAVLFFFGWFTAMSPVTWVLIILSGFVLGCGIPVLLGYPATIPEIGPKYSGGAAGIIMTAGGNIGAYTFMPHIFMPIARSTPTLAYAVICGLMALIAVAYIPIAETGHKGKEADVADDGM